MEDGGNGMACYLSSTENRGHRDWSASDELTNWVRTKLGGTAEYRPKEGACCPLDTSGGSGVPEDSFRHLCGVRQNVLLLRNPKLYKPDIGQC